MASSETLTSMISRPFSSTFEESQGLSFEHDDGKVRPQSEVFGEESKDQVIGFHFPPKKVQYSYNYSSTYLIRYSKIKIVYKLF